MSPIESYDSSLDDLLWRIATKLQITPTQHRTAEERYTAIGKWLEADGSALQVARPAIYAQGSLQIGTTVRPYNWTEYDVDLVCELQLDWQRIARPIGLLDAVEARLRQHKLYEPMVEKKRRCIRVNYSGEFHLDVIPACPNPAAGVGCLVVPDREAQGWRASNPRGYAAWFESRAKLFFSQLAERVSPPPSWAPADAKPPLKILVQLLKRWRDLAYSKEPKYSPPSILLTTLVGHLYQGEQSIGLSLALTLERILLAIEASKPRMVVVNPSNGHEDLSERWNSEAEYALFCARIREFHATWTQLRQQRGIPQVAAVLEKLFGEDVTNYALTEYASDLSKARSQGQLTAKKGSGMLGAFTSGSVVQVRPNTFYGA